MMPCMQVSMLEAQWQLLDEKWMAIKHWIQIVHDIEYGYAFGMLPACG